MSAPIIALAAKDLRLLARDRFGLFWVFGFPLILAILFGMMFGGPGGTGAKALPIAVSDEDQSRLSKAFVKQLQASPALEVRLQTHAEAAEAVRQGKCIAYLVLPKDFEAGAQPFSQEPARFELGLDPARKPEAGILRGALMEALQALYQAQLRDPKRLKNSVDSASDGVRWDETLPEAERKKIGAFLERMSEFLGSVDPESYKKGLPAQTAEFKEQAVTRDPSFSASSFEITFPVGVVWGLIGCVAAFAVGLARERTAKTLLRLRCAPIGLLEILLGKGLACFLACAGSAALVVAVGALAFKVRLENPLMLAAALASAALCFVGLMLGLSTLGRTEQGVAGSAWAVLMVLALLGGGMMPLYFMPAWMQRASQFSPVQWALVSLEGALWRGWSWTEVAPYFGGLIAVGLAGALFGWLVLRRTREQ